MTHTIPLDVYNHQVTTTIDVAKCDRERATTSCINHKHHPLGFKPATIR